MGLLDAIKDKQFRDDVADNGLNFLRSASNAAASNITGPVDAIAWALRKAGVPIHDAPQGGSQWAKNAGLLTDVKQSPASLAGETMGLLAPIGIAAGAPKIAGGLLKVADNAAAPRTMNPQTGAVVWHGSPHKFDKFDASKIGTGEGAQAYGHGLYLAESPDVAGSYAQSVKANSGELVKRGAAHGLPEDVASNLAAALQSGKKFDPVLDAARQMIDDPLTSASQRAAAQRLIDNEMAAYNAWSEWSKPGQLYKVDLPDEHIAKMLDWDKPMSQQSNEVQKALTALKDENGYDALQSLKTGYGANFQGATGQDILRALERNTSVTNGRPEVASSFLKKQGIPGIRYLDGGSRGVGSGSSNFVVFPGNEGLLSIMERNGSPIK